MRNYFSAAATKDRGLKRQLARRKRYEAERAAKAATTTRLDRLQHQPGSIAFTLFYGWKR